MTTLRLLRIGWSNLWRNPRRTAITAAALAVGVVMMVFTVSVMDGMRRDLIEQGTGLLLGHIQIHDRRYRPDRDIHHAIAGDGRALAARLRAMPGVTGAAPRAGGYALISAGETSAGVDVLGIVPGLEVAVSTLPRYLVRGRDLTARGGEPSREILIGERLAHTLEAEAGDQVVLLTQAADGSLGNELYEVAGILRTGVDLADGGLVVMPLGALQELLALPPERVHEIAVRTGDPQTARERAAAIERTLERPDLALAAWPVLSPEIGAFADMADSWTWILYAIIFALAAIAVLNTMLMAVFERLREFGVLGAIGMRPRQIVLLVAAEVAALAALSLAVAAGLAAPLLYWVIQSGIDLRSVTSGFTVSGVAIDPVMRGAWVPRHYLEAAAVLTAFALAAGLYPAVRAARVNPAALTRGHLP